jgi:hypothetical protein
MLIKIMLHMLSNQSYQRHQNTWSELQAQTMHKLASMSCVAKCLLERFGPYTAVYRMSLCMSRGMYATGSTQV